MPLWNVYCTKGTYSSEEKRAFAEAILAHAQRESAQTRSARTVLG
jgi:phenylpyruvate tautomerase PptA (4-oxalocrotonate tautomerase family)